MFTFDNIPGDKPENEVDVLFGDYRPDVIECGENNEVWVHARQSTQMMELVSKVDGRVTRRIPLDNDFDRIANCYGIGPRQIGAVRAALTSSGSTKPSVPPAKSLEPR